jgi:hypothetical protein
VVGEWDITAMKSEIKSTYQNDVQTLTTTEIVDGSTWTQTIDILNTDSTRILEGNVLTGRNKIVFDKDGRVSEIYEYEYTVEVPIGEDGGSLKTNTRIKEELSGTWNFLNNIDDFKNKERLAIVIEESKKTTQIYTMEILEDSETIPQYTLDTTYSIAEKYANGQLCTIWELIMLKNKQIKSIQDVNYFRLQTTNGIGGTFQEVGYKTQTLTRP